MDTCTVLPSGLNIDHGCKNQCAHWWTLNYVMQTICRHCETGRPKYTFLLRGFICILESVGFRNFFYVPLMQNVSDPTWWGMSRNGGGFKDAVTCMTVKFRYKKGQQVRFVQVNLTFSFLNHTVRWLNSHFAVKR